MWHTQLNFYSLLIPLVIFSLGICTLIVYQFKKFANYLKIYACALVALGLSIFLHTSLQPMWLIKLMPIVFGLYFLACALHSHAIYQRLNIPSHTRLLGTFVIFGTLAIGYFSYEHDIQRIRVIITFFMTASLYLQRPILLVKSQPSLNIDRFIRFATLGLVFIVIIRGLGLSIFVDENILISNYAIIWSMTQLLFISIDMLFLALFITCAILDNYKKLYQERTYDSLTGLLNRRALKEYLQQLNYESENTVHTYILADLDHFKRVNDTYGHHCGDLVLQNISQLMKEKIRTLDRIARVGGEEFCIILPATSLDQAIEIAECIRKNIIKNPFIYRGNKIQLTMSIGISCFSTYAEIEQAKITADNLLYQAKKMGRNAIHYEYQST